MCINHLLLCVLCCLLYEQSLCIPVPPHNRPASGSKERTTTPADFLMGKAGDAADRQLIAPAKVAQKQPLMVKPAAHLEAVPLERDGKLNKKFREELFLAKDTNNIELDSGGVGTAHDDTEGKDTKRLVQDLFAKADVQKRGRINESELETAVIQNIQHHLDEAIQENKQIFAVIDQDGDGVVTWNEYHFHFLVDNNLMNAEQAKQHSEDEHENMDDEKQEKMELDNDNFQQVDQDGKEGLNEQEFLAFRHPEHNAHALKEMVESIMRALDKDNDGQLTEDEFAAAPPGEVDPEWAEQEKRYQKERRDEFAEIIDTDKNGFATQKELEAFVNPQNPMHAKQEVRSVFEKADTNRDKYLSLNELMEHRDQLALTGVLMPVQRMHDDL